MPGSFEFNPLDANRRLSMLLVFLAITPALAVGWIGYTAMFNDIRSESMETVDHVATAKHGQLVMVLKRAHNRTALLLSHLSAQCGRAARFEACATNLIKAHLVSESALGATLRRQDGNDLTIGTPVAQGTGAMPLLAGQLAQLSGTGPEGGRSYSVTATEQSSGMQLAVTYPTSNLQPIFDRPAELGNSGETFLVDGEGYFVTLPRYESTQGYVHPITAPPMQRCLSGTSDHALDLDYRNAQIIHGFHPVPELGNACIMAHIDAAEAFAPATAIRNKGAAILAACLTPVVLMALFIARRIRRTEAALLASENKLRLMFESANDGLMVLDLDGRIKDINRTVHERLGYSREEMVGQSIRQFDPPEFAGKVPARFAEMQERGQAMFESAHVRKDGSQMPVEVSARLIELDGEQKIFSVIRDISERKRDQDQFRMILRTSLDGFWTTNEQGRFLEVNDAYSLMSGYSQEELLTMRISDVDAVETPEETARHIRELMASGSIRFETRHRTKDGRILDIAVSATYTPKYGGRIYGFLHDITKRKQVERALLHSTQRLEDEVQRRTAALTRANEVLEALLRETDDLYQNAPCGYHSVDPEGTLVRMNDTELKMLGYTRNEIIGKKVQDLLSPASQALFREQFSRFKEQGHLRNLEVEYVRKDGSILPTLLNTSAVLDADGEFVMSRATVYDMTEHMQAERIQTRLYRALKLLSAGNTLLVRAEDEQTLLDSICRLVVETGGYLMAWVGIAEQDEEKTVRPVAQSGYEEGYLSNVRISWADTELGRGTTGTAIRTGTTQVNQDIQSHPGMRPWRDAALTRGYHSNISLPITCLGRTLGALTIYAVDQNAFVADEIVLLEELAGNLAYGIATLRTRQQSAEAELQLVEYRKHLEELVARRTAELTSAKLEAERANNAKSRFLAAASHDLRQPLSALKLYAYVLANKLDAEEKELLLSMQGCITGLSDLLSKLLDLSKLEAGVVTPRPADFRLDETINKVIAAHAPEAEAKALRLRAGPLGVTVHTDPVLFQRVIGNLVSNAVTYTERGGVLVGLRRRHGRMWVEVWDTGIGIPADKTEEVFEEFKQLGDGSRTRGSGLGLTIVAKTAELLGLQLRVQSRPGHGSMFAIELPLGKAARKRKHLESAYLFRFARVALVDDNPIVLNALAVALRDAGHEVVAATTGRELLERLGSRAPDIMVCDYRLTAGETGYDVIKRARLKFSSELPAIIITGDTDPNLMRSMAEKGIAIHYKPVEFDALQQRIEEAVNRPSPAIAGGADSAAAALEQGAR